MKVSAWKRASLLMLAATTVKSMLGAIENGANLDGATGLPALKFVELCSLSW